MKLIVLVQIHEHQVDFADVFGKIGWDSYRPIRPHTAAP